MNIGKDIQIIKLDSVPSTNTYAKTLAKDGKDAFIVAREQPQGRGTKGRSFSSAIGGVYATLLHFPKNARASSLPFYMQHTAVAVCKTLERFSLTPQIKWPNDIWVDGKKICGILIENTLSGNKVDHLIIGIGINVKNELPNELRAIATTVCEQTKTDISPEQVWGELLFQLKKSNLQSEYERYLALVDEEIEISFISGEEKTERALFLGVDEQGRLLASINGQIRAFSSAEISVRREKDR